MSGKRGTLIVIAGPTGSGKTDVSIELALRIGAPIISTDSRQVFRGMAIGTAQPTREQQDAVKHYFIADREITDSYTAGQFEKEALVLLEELFSEFPYVVAVGGSGLYINALCHGMDDLPLADKGIRERLEQEYKDDGLEPLLLELRERDPVFFEVVDRNNPVRVIRALEVCLVSGKPYSEQRTGAKTDRDFNIIKVGITLPRGELYDRIDRRVDKMLEDGLEQEARALYPQRHLNALQTVGYRELFGYFEGKVTFEEAVELLKRNSRRYAKRQLTWFNRDDQIRWFANDEINGMENYFKKFAE